MESDDVEEMTLLLAMKGVVSDRRKYFSEKTKHTLVVVRGSLVNEFFMVALDISRSQVTEIQF